MGSEIGREGVRAGDLNVWSAPSSTNDLDLSGSWNPSARDTIVITSRLVASKLCLFVFLKTAARLAPVQHRWGTVERSAGKI